MNATSSSVVSPISDCRPGVPIIQAAVGIANNILLIDDDVWFRRLVRALLVGTSYLLIEAEDGGEGISLLRRTPVDLLITDIVMPGQGGLAVIDAVRSACPRLKILAVSGVNGKEYYLRAAEMMGADASLEKPVTRKSLLEVFDRLAES